MFVSPNFIRDLSIGQKKKLVWFHTATQNKIKKSTFYRRKLTKSGAKQLLEKVVQNRAKWLVRKRK